MGHDYVDPYAGPLRPHIKKAPPQWHPSYNPWKDYEGREDWWSEAGYKDPYVARGIERLDTPLLKEYDPYWYDPPLADGTSLAGPQGYDSKYNRDFTSKADQIGNFWEFQKKIRENSAQFKQIMAKWNISPEHPGVDVNPSMDEMEHETKWSLGKMRAGVNLYHFGPRFWDKPMNEGCLEKGLCLSKFALILTFVKTLSDIKAFHALKTEVQPGWRDYLKLWANKAPIPTAVAFSYGVAACTAATVRNIDDYTNWQIAGAVTGAITASLTSSIPKGVLTGIGGIVGGMYVHLMRISETGWSGRVVHQGDGHYHFGPTWWNMTQWGEIKTPKEKF